MGGDNGLVPQHRLPDPSLSPDHQGGRASRDGIQETGDGT
jgi:hypothetical protein